jgi:hypothetical protein
MVLWDWCIILRAWRSLFEDFVELLRVLRALKLLLNMWLELWHVIWILLLLLLVVSMLVSFLLLVVSIESFIAAKVWIQLLWGW